LLTVGFVVPDLKPLTTSWLHSRQSAAQSANLTLYRLTSPFPLELYENDFSDFKLLIS